MGNKLSCFMQLEIQPVLQVSTFETNHYLSAKCAVSSNHKTVLDRAIYCSGVGKLSDWSLYEWIKIQCLIMTFLSFSMSFGTPYSP